MIEPKSGITTPGTTIRLFGEGFSTETTVYFDGLEVRKVQFIDTNTLEVVTPYLRPGSYRMQFKSGETIVESDLRFGATPSVVDAEIDRALKLAGQGQTAETVTLLREISKTNLDPQVRAFLHYQIGQLYFARGDLWRWSGEAASVFDPAAGRAVQTSWRYRLSYDLSTYFLPIGGDQDTPLSLLDGTVEHDVTLDCEPRFFRGLLNARFGNLAKAKIDSDFILSQEADNPSYRALGSYIAVLNGDKAPLQAFSDQTITDPRALSLLGEAAYLSGDRAGAQILWEQAAKIYPLGASLAYWAGKKHMAQGQQRIAASLFTECTVIAPSSKEAKEAQELLSKLQKTPSE